MMKICEKNKIVKNQAAKEVLTSVGTNLVRKM